MLNKKVKTLLFIFLILFFAAAVNAESVDDNIDREYVDIINVDNDAYVATIEDEGSINEKGNFSALNKTINSNENGVINLDKDYVFNSTTDNSFKDGIKISKNITINGNGHTIDGNYKARIFDITSKGTLTIKNIKIVNGNSTSYVYGGAINNVGNLTVINSTFNNNSVRSSSYSTYGGAIYNTGNLTVINSTFNNNSVTGSISIEGGAIFSSGSLTVINSTFNDNFAMTISTGSGSSPTRGVYGGAIYSSSGTDRYKTTVNIVNSTFNHNYVTTGKRSDFYVYGGAVYSSGNLVVNNSTFTNNFANGSTSTFSNYGGAIYNGYSSNLTVTNSKFINNTASQEGGAIISFSGINIINSTFTNNTSNLGGAILNHYGNLNVTNSAFNNNYANSGGGAIQCSYSSYIYNSTFDNNSANNGGALYLYSSGNIVVVNSTFNNNIARSSSVGGAIYIRDSYSRSLTVSNSTFNNNSALNGGAIYSACIVYVSNSTFNNNTATSSNYDYYNYVGGGAIYCSNGYITNSTFVNNTSFKHGGAVFANSYLDITNSTFINNTAYNGGAVYDTNDINVKNSLFVNNSAYTGALYISTGNVIESTFIGNNATNGGAIAIIWGNVNIDNCKFAKNNATKGGAIYYKNTYLDDYFDQYYDEEYYEEYGEYYKEYLELLDELKSLNPDDYDDIQDYLDDLEWYLEEIKEYQKELEDFLYIMEDLEWYSSASIYITNSEFDENHGEYGDDIYTEYDTNVLNNTYTKNSYANIYANNTIINCTIVRVLDNKTYYVTSDGEFRLYATVLADGASVNGYNLTITDGTNSYNAIYKGYGIYDLSKNLTANFTINHYSAVINNKTNNTNYIVENGTVTTNKKKNVNIDIVVDDVIYGEDVTIDIIITEEDGSISNFTGQITVEIDGKNYTVDIENGTGKLVIEENLNAGKYTITAILDETDEYNSANGTAELNVKKADPNIELNVTDIVFGENETVTIIMNPDINGNITVYINNETLIVEIKDGKGNLVLEGLEPGSYDITVDFEGNNNFNPGTASGNFTVKNEGIILDVDDLTKYYGHSDKLNSTLTDLNGNPIANQTITITINGITYTRSTDENGIASLSITLIPGVYEAEIKYGNITKLVTVTVISTIESKDLVKHFRNGTHYYAKFYNVDGTPLANANVTFNIHGVFYTRTTDENGIAMLNINLNPGEYIITTFNSVNGESKSNNVTVFSTIWGNDVVKFYRNGTHFYAYVLDLDGTPLKNKNVSFNIHGVFYNRTTDENGLVRLNILLNPGEYIITAMNLVNNETKSYKVKVFTVIQSKDLEMSRNSRKPFTVTILGEKGESLPNAEVFFNIHGVFYYKTTDANGQISLDINLIAGKYIITTYYNEYSISNTITVL